MTWDKEECSKRIPYMIEIAKGNKLLRTNGTLTKITKENKNNICPYFDSFTDEEGNKYATLKQDVFLVGSLEVIRWNNTVVDFSYQYRIITPDMDVSEYKTLGW